jgi:hypothetical protein
MIVKIYDHWFYEKRQKFKLDKYYLLNALLLKDKALSFMRIALEGFVEINNK